MLKATYRSCQLTVHCLPIGLNSAYEANSEMYRQFVLLPHAAGKYLQRCARCQTISSDERFPNMCYTVLEPLLLKHLETSMSNDDNSVPVVQGETLLYLSDGQEARLTVGTPAWYAWLDTTTRFAFRSPFWTFTARKERGVHQRGG